MLSCKKRFERLLLLVAVFLILFSFYSCFSGSRKTIDEENLQEELNIIPVIGEGPSYFSLINQDSQLVTHKLFEGKIWVTDFFFTTCPTICPRMSDQMARLRDTFLSEQKVMLLSHTIDPEHDRPYILKKYLEKLGGGLNKWQMVTGEKDTIYDLAEKYAISVQADESAPGGFIHSGAFVLIDQQGKIRGYYDGTKEKEVNKLIRDIRKLLVSDYN